MSLRLEMLQAARLAPRLLGESKELVRGFLLGQQNTDGGFKNRTGQSDLYYSVFGIEALMALSPWSGQSASPALQLSSEQLESYVHTFESGEGLDLVHLCCLIRCWTDVLATANKPMSPELKRLALWHLDQYRAKDGGYNPVPNSEVSTPYGCFLVLGAYQDAGTDLPDPSALTHCLGSLQNANGSWENATNATAAAIATLHELKAPVKPAAGEWLLARCHPRGGFLAVPNAPMPDLLSTATALHALASLGISLDPIREKCLDFLDSLWTNEGSFHGHWLDETLDSEYTYYGLLALGYLSSSMGYTCLD